MDEATFKRELAALRAKYDLGDHPFIKLVHEGKATREHLRQYAIEHYEMTIRDAGALMAQAYLEMLPIDREGARMVAQNFAEEALGLYTHSDGHAELMHRFWRDGIGLPLEELERSNPSAAARAFNAEIWRIARVKPRYIGTIGMAEGCERAAYRKMLEGVTRHYGISPEAAAFFAVHVEADEEHEETGHKLVDRLIRDDFEQREFLAEAAVLLDGFRKGFDAMLAV
jgi:pyrroloquinoline quinone (PQQ) biosynthesis protein C